LTAFERLAARVETLEKRIKVIEDNWLNDHNDNAAAQHKFTKEIEDINKALTELRGIDMDLDLEYNQEVGKIYDFINRRLARLDRPWWKRLLGIR